MTRFPYYQNFDLVKSTQKVLRDWEKHRTFEQSLAKNKNNPPISFYEGPPGANGAPGLHHLHARVLKDLFCRYYTMCGHYVARKSGWDAHGLPVELAVEKELGIKKEDIGEKISIEAFNAHCKKAVTRYQKEWEVLTKKIGYWLDLKEPYITAENSYINVAWGLLKELHAKQLLYKGSSIQPYSPAAGTGLSAHELNQHGCYKDIKETTIVAQFQVNQLEHTYLLAWTTTPWTLPANSALAVGHNISYVRIATYNRYTHLPIQVILAKEAVSRYFNAKQENQPMHPPKDVSAELPWKVVGHHTSDELVTWTYTPLFSYIKPEKGAFTVVKGEFVTTKEGTGIVHIAPTFGGDDWKLAQKEHIPSITVRSAAGTPMPIVDRQGRFVAEITDFAGRYVKAAYESKEESRKEPSVDIQIAIKLKKENKAFLVASHTHSYPHCWRTDKPIIYYPLNAWFIKTTQYRDRLVALNKTINWHPKVTGEKRFGHWLEHIVDWNLTRARFWGTPLPIWISEDGKEKKCIGSLEELRQEVAKACAHGCMEKPLSEEIELHRPYVDEIVLVSEKGKKMYREKEVLDVWFDSGVMPYAQHARLDNPTKQPPKDFPADFIIEGIDQTRGWFFTLHTLAVLLFDSVAFKNVLASGLVVDKKGNKMSKRLGNTIDPHLLLDTYGADLVRWYLITNSDPWENVKFDVAALQEIRNHFFNTLHHTYQFFALYANIDQWSPSSKPLDFTHATQSDRWIFARLQTLIQTTRRSYENYRPTQAARAMQDFLINDLSNWYVRLNRKRFWQAANNEDKHAAYHTLHTCLLTLTKLAAPMAPFYMEQLYNDLTNQESYTSVHWATFPMPNPAYENDTLEKQMAYAQKITSLVHSLRKKHKLKVRQPLGKLLIPITEKIRKEDLAPVASLICSEVNVKEILYLTDTTHVLEKKVRPNFATLPRDYKPKIKEMLQALGKLTQQEIARWEREGSYMLTLDNASNEQILLERAHVLITTHNIQGWASATHEHITIALDLTLTPSLIEEGRARELVKRLQSLRKEEGLAVEDKISLTLAATTPALKKAIEKYESYIRQEVQIRQLSWATSLATPITLNVEGETTEVAIAKVA